jgi:DNA-binding Lrp family transcriptional regulator
MRVEAGLDDLDRRIVAATQEGLPLSREPYQAVADSVGVTAETVMARMRRMLETGVIRRLGVIPNHYALGYRANGMSVWQIPAAHLSEAGRCVGALEFVSHCYHRPPHPPDWPYNLFAMVHGRGREAVAAQVAQIAELLGPWDLGHEVLYSRRILKKTGLRI